MGSETPEVQKATPSRVTVWPETIDVLAEGIGAEAGEREEVRVWSMSGVERLHLKDSRSVILKYAVEKFGAEVRILRHAWAHGVPVPKVLSDTVQPDGSVAFLLDDLGDEVREATLADAAEAALKIHRCPPLDGLPVLDEDALASLPSSALRWLDELQSVERWETANDNGIRKALEQIDRVAKQRAAGAAMPPWGLCHSEFHPTSLHVTDKGPFMLDLARAFVGPGLLDLVSWQGTVEPMDLGKVTDLLDAYLAVGGPQEAVADRGSVPAAVWAGGWFKMWVTEWFLEATFRYATTAEHDASNQLGTIRNLNEVLECLVND